MPSAAAAPSIVVGTLPYGGENMVDEIGPVKPPPAACFVRSWMFFDDPCDSWAVWRIKT
jgi:hypothetical protein